MNGHLRRAREAGSARECQRARPHGLLRWAFEVDAIGRTLCGWQSEHDAARGAPSDPVSDLDTPPLSGRDLLRGDVRCVGEALRDARAERRSRGGDPVAMACPCLAALERAEAVGPRGDVAVRDGTTLELQVETSGRFSRCRLDHRGDLIGHRREQVVSEHQLGRRQVRGLVEVRVEEHASDLHQDSAAVGEPAHRVE